MQYFEDIELDRSHTSAAITVGKDDIIGFASEWDPLPYHTDEEAARQWPLGLTASGLHTIALSVKLCHTIVTDPPAVVAGLGWDELRLPHPVRPGDTLHVVTWVENKRESASKPDLGIVTTVIEARNQDDRVVLRYKISTLVMKRPTDA